MFQVGDEVYVPGVIKRSKPSVSGRIGVHLQTDNKAGLDDITLLFSPELIIPASRVTVAPARRKAEFPKDWGREAWFSDDATLPKDDWSTGVLRGFITGRVQPYIDSRCTVWQFCEVEE